MSVTIHQSFRFLPGALLLAASALIGAASARASDVSVKLTAVTSPSAGQPGVTSISLIGTNFPSGTIIPTHVRIYLMPATSGTGTPVSLSPSTVATLFGSTRMLTFTIPTSISTTVPVSYLVSLSGQDSNGTSFSSVRSSALTIEPSARIASISPNVAAPGKSLVVTITGSYTNFITGSTKLTLGSGVSVGGAPPGTPGPVTVVNETTAAAQLAIDAKAVAGQRTPSVQTGIQIAGLTNGFAISASRVSVPNVLNRTEAAATEAIRNAVLVVGSITLQSSSTVAKGDVISENPIAGTIISAGSAVNLVVSTGPVTNTPVSINPQLSRFILTAGDSATFSDVAVDKNGNPVSTRPVCSIIADIASARGTPPVISAGTITTATDTRGVYTLTCSLTSPALKANSSFTVLPPTDTSITTTEQATFSAFSATTTTSRLLLQQIKVALNSNNQAGVNAALAQLKSALNAVDLEALSRSMAFAPEGGFPVDVDRLPSFGIDPTTQDTNVGPYLTNLIAALQNLTSFLQTTPLATLTTSQQTTYKQLQTMLATLVAQLPSLNPSAYGIVANVDQEDFLLSIVLPQYYQALARATIQYFTEKGFTASLRPLNRVSVLAETDGVQFVAATWHGIGAPLVKTGARGPIGRKRLGMAFQFGTALEVALASAIQMDYINELYGPYFNYLERAAATLAIHGALQVWKGADALDGIISGASQSFFVFHFAGTVIEGDNLNMIPQNNQVYLIGPDQITGVAGVASYLHGLHAPKDLDDAFKEVQGLRDLFKKTLDLYNEATQPPDSTNNFCIIGNSPPCIQLVYNDGFKSVYQPPAGLPLPAPVIIFAFNKPAGVWSTGVFNFEPSH